VHRQRVEDAGVGLQVVGFGGGCLGRTLGQVGLQVMQHALQAGQVAGGLGQVVGRAALDRLGGPVFTTPRGDDDDRQLRAELFTLLEQAQLVARFKFADDHIGGAAGDDALQILGRDDLADGQAFVGRQGGEHVLTLGAIVDEQHAQRRGGSRSGGRISIEGRSAHRLAWKETRGVLSEREMQNQAAGGARNPTAGRRPRGQVRELPRKQARTRGAPYKSNFIHPPARVKARIRH
jgi:hypothetical protein